MFERGQQGWGYTFLTSQRADYQMCVSLAHNCRRAADTQHYYKALVKMYFCIARLRDTARTSKTLRHLSGHRFNISNASHGVTVLLLILFTSAVHHWAVTSCKPSLSVMLSGQGLLFHTISYSPICVVRHFWKGADAFFRSHLYPEAMR